MQYKVNCTEKFIAASTHCRVLFIVQSVETFIARLHGIIGESIPLCGDA